MTRRQLYDKWYDWYKGFSIEALEELRRTICLQVAHGEREKSEETSVMLEVIDTLAYFKQYGIAC